MNCLQKIQVLVSILSMLVIFSSCTTSKNARGVTNYDKFYLADDLVKYKSACDSSINWTNETIVQYLRSESCCPVDHGNSVDDRNVTFRNVQEILEIIRYSFKATIAVSIDRNGLIKSRYLESNSGQLNYRDKEKLIKAVMAYRFEPKSEACCLECSKIKINIDVTSLNKLHRR